MSEWKPTIKRVENRSDDSVDNIKKLIRHGNYKRAENELIERIEADPKSADLMVLLGRVLRFQDRHEEAAQTFERAMELAPLSSEPSFRCGAAYLRLRNFERARALFENVLKIEPDSARAYLGLGATAYFDDAYDDALQHLAQAIKLDPKLGRVHEMLARVRSRLGDKDVAISELQGALDDDPDNQRILMLLVRLLHAEKRSDEALGILQSRVDSDPGNRRALRRLAGFALRTGQPDLAVATYRQLAEERELGLMDTLRLIGALIENDEIEEADRLLQSLPDRQAMQPIITSFKGNIAFRQGKFDEAIEYYMSACTQAKNSDQPEGVEGADDADAAQLWREHAAAVRRGVLRKRRRKRRGKG